MASDDLAFPAGMNANDFRNHPIQWILSNSARGSRGLPTEEELEALNLPADALSELRRECVKAAEAYDDEALRGEAQSRARSAAVSLLNKLPGEYRDPPTTEDPAATETDPDKLADMVPRPY